MTFSHLLFSADGIKKMANAFSLKGFVPKFPPFFVFVFIFLLRMMELLEVCCFTVFFN